MEAEKKNSKIVELYPKREVFDIEKYKPKATKLDRLIDYIKRHLKVSILITLIGTAFPIWMYVESKLDDKTEITISVAEQEFHDNDPLLIYYLIPNGLDLDIETRGYLPFKIINKEKADVNKYIVSFTNELEKKDYSPITLTDFSYLQMDNDSVKNLFRPFRMLDNSDIIADLADKQRFHSINYSQRTENTRYENDNFIGGTFFKFFERFRITKIENSEVKGYYENLVDRFNILVEQKYSKSEPFACLLEIKVIKCDSIMSFIKEIIDNGAFPDVTLAYSASSKAFVNINKAVVIAPGNFYYDDKQNLNTASPYNQITFLEIQPKSTMKKRKLIMRPSATDSVFEFYISEPSKEWTEFNDICKERMTLLYDINQGENEIHSSHLVK